MPIHDWTKTEQTSRPYWHVGFTFSVCLATSAVCMNAAAEDASTAKPAEEGPAKLRLEIMRSAIDDLKTTSAAIDDDDALTFAARPLLRYNDQTRTIAQTRELLDATVWRLGEHGRPTALVTLEIYPVRPGTGRMFYEFLSLSPLPFAMQSQRGPR